MGMADSHWSGLVSCVRDTHTIHKRDLPGPGSFTLSHILFVSYLPLLFSFFLSFSFFIITTTPAHRSIGFKVEWPCRHTTPSTLLPRPRPHRRVLVQTLCLTNTPSQLLHRCSYSTSKVSSYRLGTCSRRVVLWSSLFVSPLILILPFTYMLTHSYRPLFLRGNAPQRCILYFI